MIINIIKNKKFNIFCQFFIKNFKVLLISLAIIIAISSTCFFSKNKKQSNLTQTSQFYQEINNLLNSSKQNKIIEIHKFIKNNNNIYGVLVALELAKYFVNKNNFFKAEKILIYEEIKTQDKNILTQIYLRLARIQLQEKKFDEALKTLDHIKNLDWIELAQNIRGDVLLIQGKIKEAKKTYSSVVESKISPTLQELVRIKLNNLPC
ncbi:hypothetical protein F7X37_00384 [Candidatus Ecksteinia adelgidicola]|nr:hypothetical protein F7X37_00384 [Candidatus Ecksteinia adelgidicola]